MELIKSNNYEIKKLNDLYYIYDYNYNYLRFINNSLSSKDKKHFYKKFKSITDKSGDKIYIINSSFFARSNILRTVGKEITSRFIKSVYREVMND